MWGVAPLNNLTRSAKYQALGRPLKLGIPWVDLWKRGDLVRPAKLPEQLRTEDFFLGDFGLAKRLSDPETERGQPPDHFCSPERLHRKDPSPACDIWSYMVVFAMLYQEIEPFSAAHEGGVLAAMVRSLGPLPEEWKGSFKYREYPDSWYDHTLQPEQPCELESELVRLRPDADPSERENVHNLMHKVFIIRPEKRPTATELLRDPDFRAIMDIYDS